jgi:hypothetical protein
MQPDLNAIERQHVELALSLGWKMFPYAAVGLPDSKQQWCPPGAEVHISTCRDLPTFDELLAHVRALEAERARLREALDTRERQLRAAVSGIGRREHCTLVMHDAKGRIIDVVHTAPDGPETASQPWVPLPELLPINIARAALDPNRSE